MSRVPDLPAGKRRHSLARRLALYAILLSCVATLAASALQVSWEYRREVGDIERRLGVIETSYLPSLAESAWQLDRQQAGILLEGVRRLPDISFAAVTADGEEIAASGRSAATDVIERRWPLTRRYRGRDIVLGELTVQASLKGPRAHTVDRIAFILLASALWIALVAAFMFLVVHWLITRHLERIADYVAASDPKRLTPSLALERPQRPDPDELDRLVGAINTMAIDVRSAQDQMRLAASVFDSASEGIMVTDRDNNILSVNRAFSEITGYSPEEVIGRNPSLLSSGKQPDAFYDVMWATIRKTGRWQGEVWDKRKDGTSYCELLSITSVRNEQGEIIQYCAIFSDITRLKLIEAELLRTNAELEDRVAQRTAELETFSYSVSHDLRSPLRHISGFSAIVLKANEGRLDDASVDYLKRITAAGERMGALIDDLLALAQVSRQEMKTQTFDLSNLAGQVADSLARAHPERRVRLSIEPGMTASGDPGLIRILLENLLANAWKFTARVNDPIIEVGCTPRGNEAAYFIRDNGTGFDMKYAHKLFEPFQRLHTEHEFEGTGIGLSIVKRIVARHGGWISAEAGVGAGASFFFTLG